MALNPWEYADKTGNEHAHQTALFMWSARAAICGIGYANNRDNWKAGAKEPWGMETPAPLLRWLHAIHNQGHGDVKRGARARSEGVRAGVPDIFLPVPMNFRGWQGHDDFVRHGLYIELKRPDSVGKRAGSASEAQDEWISYLRSAGYQVEICYGWLEARDCIIKYLGL